LQTPITGLGFGRDQIQKQSSSPALAVESFAKPR